MSCLNLLRSLSRMKFAVITKAEVVHRVRGSDHLPNHVFSHWEISNSMGKWIFKKLLALTPQFLRTWLEGSSVPCFDFLTLPSNCLAWRICCLLVCQEKMQMRQFCLLHCLHSSTLSVSTQMPQGFPLIQFSCIWIILTWEGQHLVELSNSYIVRINQYTKTLSVLW